MMRSNAEDLERFGPLEEASPDLLKELRRDSISTRLKLVIYCNTKEKRRFPQLETLTGIPQATWRSWWKHGVVPSGALVEAVAKQWPEFAYWLATGMTDIDCGHRMPDLHPIAQGYINNWPEGGEGSQQNDDIKSDFSAQYFEVVKTLRNEVGHHERAKYETLRNSFIFLRKKRLNEVNKNIAQKSWPEKMDELDELNKS